MTMKKCCALGKLIQKPIKRRVYHEKTGYFVVVLSIIAVSLFACNTKSDHFAEGTDTLLLTLHYIGFMVTVELTR